MEHTVNQSSTVAKALTSGDPLVAAAARILEDLAETTGVIAAPIVVGNSFAGALALATVSQRMELLSEQKLVRLLKKAATAIGIGKRLS